MTRWIALALALAGCGGGGPAAPDLLDTGWFDDTASFDPETCPHKLASTKPLDGATGWYWREAPRVFVATDRHDRYDVRLIGASGEPVATTPVWSDEGLSVALTFEGGLAPSTDYLLEVTDCAERHEIAFRTSDLGQPLAGPAEDLVGKTWHLDLVNATWLEPAGIAGLLQLYFTTPVLFGVGVVQGDQIDFVAAPGRVDLFGFLKQDLTESSWDFPLADFAAAPYFEARSENVVFDFDGNEVPVSSFQFLGTFSADMTRIGGGDLSGLGDTRYLGGVIEQPDDPGAICAMAAGLGVQCEPCPTDGLPYCLWMRAVDVDATLVPGLTLQPR